MIRSMTGFGRCEYIEDNIKFVVEIKTVNHRYCDIFIKLPRQISMFEEKIRSTISSFISRGKVDVFVSYENNSENSNHVVLDINLANSYFGALKKIGDNISSLRDDVSITTLARFPDVLKLEKIDEEEKLWPILSIAINGHIDSLVQMRETEGEKLRLSLYDIAINIEKLTDVIKLRLPSVVNEYKAKLFARINELLEQKVIDETRLAMEAAIFADKCNVDEELVRLNSHMAQMRDILESDVPSGRKLDFLVQEMNREVNTIGSKGNDLEVVKNVVELKSEIEKIREQIQNIE